MVAGPVTAPVVVWTGRFDCHVEDSALGIERLRERPAVRAWPVSPAIAFPCLVAGLTRLGHRVKVPNLRATPGIERANAPGRSVRPQNQKIPIDGRRRVIGRDHVDLAILGASGCDGARTGIERDNPT